MCSYYRGISLPDKAYARVLESKYFTLVKHHALEEEYRFRPGRRMLDQLCILSGMFECAWEFTYPPYMCFLDLEKTFICIPQGILVGIF